MVHHLRRESEIPSEDGCGVSALAAISLGLGRSRPHYRGCRLRLVDARTLLVLAVRFGAGRVLRDRLLSLGSGWTSRTGSVCVFAGWGCVLRTASASIACSSALVGVVGFAILPLFVFRLRGFPGQALSLQSFVVFPESFLRFFVVGCWLPFANVLKTLSRLSSRGVFTSSIAHRSHHFSVTHRMTIDQPRRAASKLAD